LQIFEHAADAIARRIGSHDRQRAWLSILLQQYGGVPSIDRVEKIAADRGNAPWRENADNRGPTLDTSVGSRAGRVHPT
jgi:hypothetical protein